MKVKKENLKKIISKFSHQKILVVGDFILDHYIFGKVDRISPEAPVPVVWANEEKFVCGGAANVGLNLVSLGAKVVLCGVLGKDYFGDVLRSLIEKKGVCADLIIKDKQRPTTLKTRIVASHQQVVRVDWESVEFLSWELNKKILNGIKKRIDEFDAVIIEDYGKGVINPQLVRDLVDLCKKHKKIITVDPKEDHFDYYENVTALTPNLKEAQTAANLKIKTKEEILILGEIILKKLNPSCLLITLGEDGMMLFCDHRHYHIPAYAQEVFDVTGAGDTVIATFTLALSCHSSYLEAAFLSNIAASIVVAKLGAAQASKKELLQRIKEIKI
jgi:D-beta-D-heptose 7-phosphate kinase/D-beta-D-heptose 1-phosphate adenosyltransferase